MVERRGWRRGGEAELAAWWRGRAGGVVERRGWRRGGEAALAAWWSGRAGGVRAGGVVEGLSQWCGGEAGLRGRWNPRNAGRVAGRLRLGREERIAGTHCRPCSEGFPPPLSDRAQRGWMPGGWPRGYASLTGMTGLADGRADRLGGWPGRQAWRMAGQTGLADGRADLSHRDTRRRIKSRSRPGVRETPPASAHRVPEGDATASFP